MPLAALAALLALTTSASAQNWATAQYSRQISVEERAEVTLRYSSGNLTLSGANSSRLYEMRLRYDADSHAPVHSFEAGRLVLGVESTGGNRFLRSGSTDGEMAVTLTTAIPIDLTLDLGAVQSNVDLGGLRLTGLVVHTGASQGSFRVSSPNSEAIDVVEFKAGAASFEAIELGHLNAGEISLEAGVGDFQLDLSGLQRDHTSLTIRMGLGSLEVQVPTEAGVRLTRRSFLTSLTAPGLERQGEVHVSSNWEEAERRVDIAVEAALGSISILRTAP